MISAGAGRAAARLAKVLELSLAELEISLPQYRMLAFLAEGEHGASTLAGNLDVSRPTVTALVDGLVSRGWVARAQDERDRRRVTHTLTPAGETALRHADRQIQQWLDQVLAELEPEQAASVTAGLRYLGKALDKARRRRAGAVQQGTTS